MGMLTNGPTCSFSDGRDALGRPCSGNVHEYDVRKIAEPDGTPVVDSPGQKTFICEGHYPDTRDPGFLLCLCRLCKERRHN